MPLPELGIIAATRGMGAAGAALLIADRVSKKRRAQIGWVLLGIGIVSTIPLAIDVIKRRMD